MSLLVLLMAVFTLYLLACGWDNAGIVRPLPPAGPSRRDRPFVTVCIPARNEVERIRPCVESLLAQDYPNFEVLALDDQSTDGTFELLGRYAAGNSRLRALRGTPLPEGWVGKPWACHQLSLEAKGEWIFFTDADTVHAPDTLERAVRGAEGSGADLLSCVTRQETGTWLEFLVIPVMVFCLFSFLPVRLVLKKESPFSKFAGAGGQFLFFKRTAYLAIGGHTSVRNEIVEDLKIGNEVVRKGLRLVMMDGVSVTSCRMYRSARQVWEGFSKNFFPAFGFSVPRALAGYFFLLALSLLPYVALFNAPAGSGLFAASLGLALVQVLLRLGQARRFRLPALSCLLHPLGVILFVLIGFNSMRWYKIVGRGHWKGRALAGPGSGL